jgi:GNAT superfamily N-acetyltransferase
VSDLFDIRPACAKDLPLLQSLFVEDGMAQPSTAQLLAGTVAVNDDDEAVGFIQILEVSDDVNPAANGAYVYPVIVYQSWQHHGVGRALIDYELARHGTLKLVACNRSQRFYPKAGFEPLPWEQVAARVARDCELCPDLPTCHPQPFIKTL